MAELLARIADDALQRSRDGEAASAWALWKAMSSAATGAPQDVATFAGEAAFAAAARIALEQQVTRPIAELSNLFPHLYGSPLFSWYRLPDPLRDQLSSHLSDGPADSPMEPLGWLYQFAVPVEIRKRFGQFYTQPAIVRAMLDGVRFRGPETIDRRLIDPAVGAGAFAIEATRRVISAAEEVGLHGAEVCRAVQRVIHGMDLNPLGILLTEAAISFLLVPHLNEAGDMDLEPLHLYVTDSLRQGELPAEAHSEIVEEIKARRGAYAEGFDYVVANPPYSKFPSRRMTEEQVRRFSATTYGHPNLYGLFLQVGVELLAENGRLSFINPKSFVSGLYFRNLRRFLGHHLDLIRFDTFDRRTGIFDGVLQDVVILTAQKSTSRVAKIELREFAGPPDGQPIRQIKARRSSVLLDEHFDSSFFIAADQLAHDLLARVTNGTSTLAALGYEVVTGTVVWNRLKEHMRDEAAAETLPLVWGNGIRAFRFLGFGNRDGQASHAALVDKTRGLVSRGDAILVKRMTAKEEDWRLVACRVPAELSNSDAGYFAENHVNLVRAAPGRDAEVELDAVLGLLNSRLYDYVFRSLNGNTQVSATELERLPVRTGDELDQIAKRARRLSATDGSDLMARADLDRLVCQLYGLNEHETSSLLVRETTMAAS